MFEVQMIGHLGGDPELRYTPDGDAVATFSVACDTGKDLTTWARVSAWRKTAESCNEYLCKGSMVFVRGRLTERDYVDRAGNPRVSLDVSADLVKFLSKKPSEPGSDGPGAIAVVPD